ncbi:hypothetical protein PIB30_034332 [Stylosanthes scabra]|uniref:Uncharacterized protein n=1 Tax=Stylosanthes scabra TaxID=79078 RepID=A0ABU6TEW6_9FABA|nr:hypothetical protein [Stylosanthes scabra]
MERNRDGIWFRSSTPVVFQMYLVVTLEELKSVILRNMGLGAVGTSDEHVHALFDLHRRYGTREVMELLTKMQSMPEVIGDSSSSNGVIPCSPIHCPASEVPMLMDGNSGEDFDEDFVPDFEESSESSDGSEFMPESQSRRGFLLPAPALIPDLSSVNSHFHTLHLEDMDEEPMKGFGGGDDYYDVDGGQEFRVGHRFSKREKHTTGTADRHVCTSPCERIQSGIRSCIPGVSYGVQRNCSHRNTLVHNKYNILHNINMNAS